MSLFSENLPTPLRPAEMEKTDLNKCLKELEVAIQTFSKLAAEHELSDQEQRNKNKSTKVS